MIHCLSQRLEYYTCLFYLKESTVLAISNPDLLLLRAACSRYGLLLTGFSCFLTALLSPLSDMLNCVSLCRL